MQHGVRGPCGVVHDKAGFSEKILFFILIAVFLHKSSSWEKSDSWDMGQNECSWPIILHDFQIKYISRTKRYKKPDFLQVDTDLSKLKIDWRILGWAWSKMAVATLLSGL